MRSSKPGHTRPADDAATPRSPNFGFLGVHHGLLVRYAAQAERFVFEDPNLALIRLRQFAELLARLAAAHAGLPVPERDDFFTILGQLQERRVASPDVLELFHGLRNAGNLAVHHHADDRAEALHQLRMARTLGVWFRRAFGDPGFKAGPFLPPPDPAEAGRELAEELERLREQVVLRRREAEEASSEAKQALSAVEREAELRRRAETEARDAYVDLAAAMALAEESEAQLLAARAQFGEQLAAVQAEAASSPAGVVDAVVARAQEAATLLDLDEAATRRIIDQQLREAGWEADTTTLTFKNGARPQKGRNLAIAEWPTSSGPADYILFAGLTPIAAVEAKRAVREVPGAIEQAKRYSRGFSPGGDRTGQEVQSGLQSRGRHHLGRSLGRVQSPVPVRDEWPPIPSPDPHEERDLVPRCSTHHQPSQAARRLVQPGGAPGIAEAGRRGR